MLTSSLSNKTATTSSNNSNLNNISTNIHVFEPPPDLKHTRNCSVENSSMDLEEVLETRDDSVGKLNYNFFCDFASVRSPPCPAAKAAAFKRLKRFRPESPLEDGNLRFMELAEKRESIGSSRRTSWASGMMIETPSRSGVPPASDKTPSNSISNTFIHNTPANTRNKAENMRNVINIRKWFHEWINTGRQVDHMLRWIKNTNIKVIACDFDLTMTSLHSGGGDLIPGSNKEKEILKSITSDWHNFATQVSDVCGVRLGCVTFSDRNNGGVSLGGEALVRKTLVESNAKFCIDKVYAFLPRNYNIPEVYQSIGLSYPMPNDKTFHLSLLCNDFGVNPAEVLLIDDCENNCIIAEQNGYYALTIDENAGFHFARVRPAVLPCQ